MRPAGWPAGLVDPRAPDFAQRAVEWLLDAGPGEWRTEAVWREYPRALAHRLRSDLGARLVGARESYASARVALSGADVDIDRVLTALEREGALLAARLREVELVAQALEGARWRPRL